ncbi:MULTISPECIES: helix-turn-helix domain-containing protein [unclassified Nonomuraea]|uniref:helix-turn-helix domain-containing protein n=1 Tax=unclassified Nonomuraea TaxID=2593643 RepID=UPI0033DB75AE
MIAEPTDRQPKPLMKVPEVAALFEVEPETVRVWARTGKLPSRKNPGGRVLVFLRTDVEALLEAAEEPLVITDKDGPGSMSRESPAGVADSADSLA